MRLLKQDAQANAQASDAWRCSSNALRTQARTYVELTNVDLLSPVSNARRGAAQKVLAAEGITTLGAELAALVPVLKPQKRQPFPVIRTKNTATRAEIKPQLRREVYARDHFRCVWCGSGKELTLDHITPWSAGGSDEDENLRTLCSRCNTYRRNFHHPADELCGRLPMTCWCIECDAGDRLPNRHPGLQPAYCYWCKHKSLGIPSRWFTDNNAFWDYDLNWHRDEYPGFTRDAWEEACSRLKFPILYEDKPPSAAVQRAMSIQEVC